MTAVSSIRVRTAHGNSFNHLVGTGSECVRHRNAQAQGRLKVDRHVEPGGVLDRQVGRLAALGDAVDIVGHVAEQSGEIDAVAHQRPASAISRKAQIEGMPAWVSASAMATRWRINKGPTGMTTACASPMRRSAAA